MAKQEETLTERLRVHDREYTNINTYIHEKKNPEYYHLIEGPNYYPLIEGSEVIKFCVMEDKFVCLVLKTTNPNISLALSYDLSRYNVSNEKYTIINKKST